MERIVITELKYSVDDPADAKLEVDALCLVAQLLVCRDVTMSAVSGVAQTDHLR